jgi:DNA repair protein RadA/Sms
MAWNSLVEEVPAAGAKPAARGPRPPSKAMPITEVGREEGGEVRLRIGIGELDRVLGGGLVTGSLTLVGGDPGVGKSTLLLTTADAFARRGIRVLYVSAEESARQVRLRAERLGVLSKDLYLLAETSIEAVLAAVDEVRPKMLVLDSVQTLMDPELTGVPGSIGQVREIGHRAMLLAKSKDIATFLIGHVTKEGSLAGPRTLEHMVDAVLYVEGDGATALRVVRATKNRFGSTGEIGLFEMREEGLVEVPDASARLLRERLPDAPGTVVTCAMVGSRPVLVEVQALVGRPTQGNPARTVLGYERGRLSMILAVLGRSGLDLGDRDVFVSVAGGLSVEEPSADLAVAAAIVSSARGVALPSDLLVFGEVGLVGEVRGVGMPQSRLREAERHGLRRAWVPRSAAEDGGRMRLEGIQRIGDVFDRMG